jgi:hypothetical protein
MAMKVFSGWSREEISNQISKLATEIVSVGDYFVGLLTGDAKYPFDQAKRRDLVLSYVRVDRETKLQRFLAEEDPRRRG